MKIAKANDIGTENSIVNPVKEKVPIIKIAAPYLFS
ncbi:hypothetical protein MGA3_03830 [Bacillus methanolicus MGA3]|nr:hypothetical protein MGA3_03830 [Bacillus methanolicus MGA3]